MSGFTPEQQKSLQIADETGRALVTMIDGRIAIVLPPVQEDQQADRIAKIVEALDTIEGFKD